MSTTYCKCARGLAKAARRVGALRDMAACPASERASLAAQAARCARLPAPATRCCPRGRPAGRSPATTVRSGPHRQRPLTLTTAGTLTTRSCRTAGCRGWRCAGFPRSTTAPRRASRSRTPSTGPRGRSGCTARPAAVCGGIRGGACSRATWRRRRCAGTVWRRWRPRCAHRRPFSPTTRTDSVLGLGLGLGWGRANPHPNLALTEP